MTVYPKAGLKNSRTSELMFVEFDIWNFIKFLVKSWFRSYNNNEHFARGSDWVGNFQVTLVAMATSGTPQPAANSRGESYLVT
jgi:hypothetical protein